MSANARERFPFPWRVEYRRRFPEWHPKSLPMIVAADGDVVAYMDCLGHPGSYDEDADLAALDIVTCVNARGRFPETAQRLGPSEAELNRYQQVDDILREQEHSGDR